jgi:uncharacterized repeat protein (TIGR03847 family)
MTDNPSFDFEAPDHFTAGTIGPPGQRVFYLQARQDARLVTLKVEKGQVAGLADYLEKLLGQLKGQARSGAREEPVELLEPIAPAWDVASLGVGYDESADRIVVVASEGAPEEEDEDEDSEAEAAAEPTPAEAEGEEDDKEEPASARFAISRTQAAAFVERARELMKAGRPICPLCSMPKDPEGHVCPRMNGHVVKRG